MAAIRVRSSTFSSSSNWACLPDDLLGSIIDKLMVHDNISDYLRFTNVCKSWNSVALNRIAKLNIPLQLPWLLITSDFGEDIINGEAKHFFYNFFTSSYIPNLKLPCNFRPDMCCGSSHGWLVFVEEKLTLIALNPLSGSTFRLPRLTDAFCWNEDEVVEKVILSRDPANSSGYSFEVLAICSLYNSNCSINGIHKIVAHLKYGDESWTYSPKNNFIKVAFYKDRIFGLSREGIVTSLAIDPSSSSSSKVIKITKDVAPPKPRLTLQWLLKAVIKIGKDIIIAPKPSLDSDFVETTTGDLLVVNRSVRGYNYVRKIQKLMIDSNGGIQLIPVVDLGGDALFLGKYSSISISASIHPNCNPNFSYDLLDEDMFHRFIFKDGHMSICWSSFGNKSFLSWFMPSMKL